LSTTSTFVLSLKPYNTPQSMGDADEPSLRSVKSKAATALGLGRKKDTHPTLPTHNPHITVAQNGSGSGDLDEKRDSDNPNKTSKGHPDAVVNTALPVVPPGHTTAKGETASTIGSVKRPLWSPARIKDGSLRFLNHTKSALLHSWINVMLVFVPIGIAAKLAHLKPEIVFSMNAIAIIPLAGLLAHATEVVAARVGDALGALINVSFGNAVELILFIILLASGQIEVVQASLLGSILANLLLILGMAFLLGGLKYQEQVRSLQTLVFRPC
jgi:Ca2+:H+ antiporter